MFHFFIYFTYLQNKDLSGEFINCQSGSDTHHINAAILNQPYARMKYSECILKISYFKRKEGKRRSLDHYELIFGIDTS